MSNITGSINLTTNQVTGTLTVSGQSVTGTVNVGGGSVPPSVLAHISRTDNPHSVTEDQLLHGLDYTLIFENVLSQQ